VVVVEGLTAGVAVLPWPDGEERRQLLHRLRRPRLLLIAPGQAIPIIVDRLEDWAFTTAASTELEVRVEALAARARLPVDARPYFDESDLLRFDGRWVAVPPAEYRILRLLVDRFEECVPRLALEAHALTPGACSLNSTVKRLRDRLAPLGLTIGTVHGRGYALGRRPFDAPGPPNRLRRR
jgi:hypothetical protein